jgi:hypothetical protein
MCRIVAVAVKRLRSPLSLSQVCTVPDSHKERYTAGVLKSSKSS